MINMLIINICEALYKTVMWILSYENENVVRNCGSWNVSVSADLDHPEENGMEK